MKKKVSVLGSTGSIGRNTLDIILKSPDLFEVVALTGHQNIKLLIEQAIKLKPAYVAIADKQFEKELKDALSPYHIETHAGEEAILYAAQMPADIIVSAIVGAHGLKPTFEALKQGTTLAIANKESIVSGGFLFIEEANKYKTHIIPLDSEHNAIYQLLNERSQTHLSHITITASGGPFRTLPLNNFEHITPQQAIKHPNWAMGVKNSIDSATLMNKGIELIECCYLFNLTEDKVHTIIHPQSIIHGLIHFQDGCTLAQLSVPDMRVPISYALSLKNRLDIGISSLDFTKMSSLDFEPIDPKRFPSVQLAREAFKNNLSLVYNVANEIAVDLFYQNKIKFLDIFEIVEGALDTYTYHIQNLNDVVLTHLNMYERIKTSFRARAF